MDMKLKLAIPLRSALFLSTFSLLIMSCSGDKNKTNENSLLSDSTRSAIVKVNNEIFSIPSPIQTAMLIKKSGVAFQKNILNSPEKSEHYTTNFTKALNVGVYGADLGYIAIYDQKQDAFQYMKSVKTLAEELGISDAFNQEIIERFSKNMNNKDSLLSLISVAYRTTNAYLKSNEQNDISGLIVAGGWIEGLHLATEIYSLSSNEEIKHRIAEQKTSLQRVINILKPYAEKPEYTVLITNLNNLSTMYDSVEYSNTFVQATTDAAKKLTVINCKTEVKISPQQIKDISSQVKIIRKQIIE
jgi:hypothetical protein